MNRTRALTPARFLAAAAFALLAGIARGQSYGPEDQVLTINATEFTPVGSAYEVLAGDGYLYSGTTSGPSYYRAPLSLPQGALIERLCQFDYDASATVGVETHIVANKLVYGAGGNPATLVIPNSSVHSASNIGYGYYCTDALSHTLLGRIDVDGDGNADAAAYYVEANVPANLGLGAVQITWRRQVSPKPATATFGDVPLDSPYSAFIEALKASDVTGGCQQAPPLYCPDRPITRAEMAVFLAKALGLHWAD